MQIFDRRAFHVAAGSAAAVLGSAVGRARSEPASPEAAASLGISSSNAAIHQEVVFKSSADRLYLALTDPSIFEKVVVLSGAVKSMSLASAPAQIDARPGGAFSLFGGYITGRQIELSPGVRIIQAWRSQSWPPHIFSIARFEFAGAPEGVKLIFDQTGFPNEDAVSLATGWRDHYWAPLAKVL